MSLLPNNSSYKSFEISSPCFITPTSNRLITFDAQVQRPIMKAECGHLIDRNSCFAIAIEYLSVLAESLNTKRLHVFISL